MKKDVPSIIGIRAVWTCCTCATTAATVQIATIGVLGRVRLEPPPGWRVRRGLTYCSDHERRPFAAVQLECAA